MRLAQVPQTETTIQRRGFRLLRRLCRWIQRLASSRARKPKTVPGLRVAWSMPVAKSGAWP